MTEDICQLVGRCKQGDQLAMRQLVDRFRAPVFGLCYRMLGHRQDAEDTAQETFVRMLRSLERWDVQRDFQPWLLAIAANRCRTHLAARQRRPKFHPLNQPPMDRHHDLQAARNLAEEVELAQAQLREDHRQAFLLFHEQELSYGQISTVLGCPLGTVKTWVHRARREIIQRLINRGVVSESRHELRRV